jgi:hypothetical protein
MRANVLAFKQTTFGEEWSKKVLPLLKINSLSSSKTNYMDIEDSASLKKTE